MSTGALELLEIYEAAAAWQAIVAWNEQRGFDLQTEWPRRELARVREARDGPH